MTVATVVSSLATSLTYGVQAGTRPLVHLGRSVYAAPTEWLPLLAAACVATVLASYALSHYYKTRSTPTARPLESWLAHRLKFWNDCVWSEDLGTRLTPRECFRVAQQQRVLRSLTASAAAAAAAEASAQLRGRVNTNNATNINTTNTNTSNGTSTALPRAHSQLNLPASASVAADSGSGVGKTTSTTATTATALTPTATVAGAGVYADESPLLDLPPELLLLVMGKLDVVSIGRLARTCSKLAALARDPMLWRGLCITSWPDSKALSAVVPTHYYLDLSEEEDDEYSFYTGSDASGVGVGVGVGGGESWSANSVSTSDCECGGYRSAAGYPGQYGWNVNTTTYNNVYTAAHTAHTNSSSSGSSTSDNALNYPCSTRCELAAAHDPKLCGTSGCSGCASRVYAKRRFAQLRRIQERREREAAVAADALRRKGKGPLSSNPCCSESMFNSGSSCCSGGGLSTNNNNNRHHHHAHCMSVRPSNAPPTPVPESFTNAASRDWRTTYAVNDLVARAGGMLRRIAWSAVVTDDSPRFAAVRSHFGGVPCLGPGDGAPVCGSCGIRLSFMVQLDLGAGLPRDGRLATRFAVDGYGALPNTPGGLLQLWVCTANGGACDTAGPFSPAVRVRIVPANIDCPCHGPSRLLSGVGGTEEEKEAAREAYATAVAQAVENNGPPGRYALPGGVVIINPDDVIARNHGPPVPAAAAQQNNNNNNNNNNNDAPPAYPNMADVAGDIVFPCLRIYDWEYFSEDIGEYWRLCGSVPERGLCGYYDTFTPALSLIPEHKALVLPDLPLSPKAVITRKSIPVPNADAVNVHVHPEEYMVKAIGQGDKLGGWPGLPCRYPVCPVGGCVREMDNMIFQLCSEHHLPWMFGDCGIGQIVQCPVHRDAVTFLWACPN